MLVFIIYCTISPAEVSCFDNKFLFHKFATNNGKTIIEMLFRAIFKL